MNLVLRGLNNDVRSSVTLASAPFKGYQYIYWTDPASGNNASVSIDSIGIGRTTKTFIGNLNFTGSISVYTSNKVVTNTTVTVTFSMS